MMRRERYRGTLIILEYGVSRKMDGCAEDNEPDSNDWLITCDAQGVVHPLISEASVPFHPTRNTIPNSSVFYNDRSSYHRY